MWENGPPTATKNVNILSHMQQV